MPALRTYWFTFPRSDGVPWAVRLGVGVTAWTIDDARAQIRQTVLGGRPLPEPHDVNRISDIRTLDPGHVRPFINPPNFRGVWFPRGFMKDFD